MDSGYGALIRMRVFEDIYNKMSDEEKRLIALYLMQDSRHEDVMGALRDVSRQVDSDKYNFGKDLLANITGNAVWDGTVWLLSSLVRNIK